MPNKKLINYSYLEQVKDMLSQIGLFLFMEKNVYCVQFIGLNDLLTLLIEVAVGAIIYYTLKNFPYRQF